MDWSSKLFVLLQSSEAPVRLFVSSSLQVGTWRSVMFARWISAPSREDVRVLRDQVLAVSRISPRFAGFNFVSATQATRFDDDVRTEIAAMRREFSTRQIAIATVIEGAGFWAATVRSVAAGLALLQREPFPSKNFDAIDPAVDWLAPLVGCITPKDVQTFRTMAHGFRREQMQG